jgi:hypothetical protein
MEKSGIRGAAFDVYGTLLMIEALAPHNRPKSMAELAGRCGKSMATLTRALAKLESYFWITRDRGGGKGNPTRVEAVLGVPVERKQTLTNAEKCRAYRRRERARKAAATGGSETQTTPKTEQQTTPGNGAQSGLTDTSFLVSETGSDQAKLHTDSSDLSQTANQAARETVVPDGPQATGKDL